MSTFTLPKDGTISVDLNIVDDAGFFLRSLVKKWREENRHIDPAYVNDLSALPELLGRETEFYAALKEAALADNYQPIRDSDLLLRTSTRKTRAFLDEIKPKMRRYVDGHSAFPAWAPDAFREDEDLHSHLMGLDLLKTGGGPSMLLDRLGKFYDDPAVRDRIHSIFVRGKDTFLVNTSGSGKTRLTFEALCHEWGFYFSAADDASGYSSRELTDALTRQIPRNGFAKWLAPMDSENFSEQLKVNQQIAAHHFNAVLLARLLMFQLFAEIMHESTPAPEHKMRWLLFQLRPRIGGAWDCFRDMKNIVLAEVDDSYTNENIVVAMEKIRAIFGGELHLFYVLDEAQAAATAFPSAFCTGGNLHPILPEILRAWQAHTVEKFNVSLVITGVQIPKHIFDYEGNSSLRHRWSSDTGSFDEETQRRYIEHFIPPSIAGSQTADQLLSRAWMWLRGRYRFISAFVQMLLLNGFLPADPILDDFFNNFTHVPPPDSDTDLYCIKSLLKTIAFGRYSILKFSILATDPFLKETLRHILFHYLVTNKHPGSFSNGSIELVTQGMGRFIDAEGKKVVADEPLILAGAANWLLGCSEAESSGVNQPIHSYYSVLLRDPPNDSKALAKCLAYYFTHAFDQKVHLCNVFTFAGGAPKWARQSARLVAIHSTDSGPVVSSPEYFPTLATCADSMAETVSWLQHRERTPFCIPSTSGLDLIFALKMADGTFIWVILAAPVATDKKIKESELKSALSKLQDANLFGDEDEEGLCGLAKDALRNLPNLSSKLGAFGVLRVVASFPAQPAIGRLPAAARHHAAALNMGLFERIHEDIPAIDMVKDIVSSIGGLPRPYKRKSVPDDSPGSPSRNKRKKSIATTPTTGTEPENTNVRRSTRKTS